MYGGDEYATMTEKGGKDKGQESGPPLLAAMKALLAATSWPIPSRRSSYLGEARLTVELNPSWTNLSTTC